MTQRLNTTIDRPRVAQAHADEKETEHMRIFMTGASGWIGSAVVPHLIEAGHEVAGLARSDASASALEAAGVIPVRGGLDDLDVLRTGAEASDAVIHLAFKHDFDNFAASGRTERAALETFGDALEGTGRKFMFASGLAGFPSRALTERDESPFAGPDAPRGGSEQLAMSFAERGIAPVALRFAPTVHGAGDHGFSAVLVRIARERGVSAYVGDGEHSWAAVHRLDAGRLVSLALQKAPGGTITHAVAEQGVPTRQIAQAIGDGLGLPVVSVSPEDATEHFGWLGRFFGSDVQATSALTRELLGWQPTELGLLDDIAQNYVGAVEAAKAS
ncbi:SDR family oxidoreductase [Rathayibacter sp. KR2-224]|uniref:SDR family oxidoreductase n=1 Tax=Rathayibacter sp. KR2-224 TaxID=3400913 RepID=UPI003BFABE95